MIVRANSPPSLALVMRENVVLPSRRIDSVGLTATLPLTRDSCPSEASAKIATAFERASTDALNRLNVGVVSDTLVPNRLERPSGTANGTGPPGVTTSYAE